MSSVTRSDLAMRRLTILCLVVAVIVVGCGDDSTGPTTSVDEDLIGRWELTTINGRDVTEFDYELEWVVDSETITWTTNNGCTQVEEYSISGSDIIQERLVSQVGSCGDDASDFPRTGGSYTIVENRLTVTAPDSDVFVFRGAM